MGLPRFRPFVVVWLLCACPYQPDRTAGGRGDVGEGSSEGGSSADAASASGDSGGASSPQGEGSTGEDEAGSTDGGSSEDDGSTSVGEGPTGTASSSSSSSGEQGPICGDGVVEGDELCDDGNAQDEDGCVSTCVPAACGDGHVFAGVEDCDDGNVESADGCPSGCEIPDACDEGVDADTNAPWVVCSADADQAWISFGQIDLPASYHASQICEQLGYAGVAHYGASCPHNICGTCEAYSSCSQPGLPQFYDDVGTAVDDNGGIVLYGTVKWLCAN